MIRSTRDRTTLFTPSITCMSNDERTERLAHGPKYGKSLMIGRSEMTSDRLDIRWADAQLSGVVASYERCEFEITETSGRRVRVVAAGHIGFQLIGFWDEIVIESADIVPAHPFAERCLQSISERLGEPAPSSGSPERNAGDFSTLVVSLSDGAVLLCTAAEFHVETGR
jgi:hypothetical protein